jgi:PEP-CTERM motif
MKTFVTIGLTALGVALAAAQPAYAASLVICASAQCGAASGTTTISTVDFENGFDVNGVQVQIGLGNPNTTSVPQMGSFVDGAAQNTFSGSWIDRGASTPESETVFFTDPSGAISDVLNFDYAASSGGNGSLTGFVITGILSATDLAGVGINATAIAPEGTLFAFNNAFISSSIQTAIPEPSTWAMMMLGFAGLGYASWRRGAKARPALV